MTKEKTQQQQDLWRPIGSALEAIDEASGTGPKRNVLILGAGISGLVAAYELRRRGHAVQIIDATKDRVGGRLWTWRSDDGRFHGERAAMRIPSPHDYSLHYVEEAKLGDTLRPFVNTEHFWRVGNQTFLASDYKEKVYPLFENRLRADERPHAKEHPGNLLAHYMGPVMRSLTPARQRALLAGDFSDPVLRSMDQISWRDYLRSAGASAGALDLLGRLLGIAAVWDWSLAALQRDGLHQQGATYQEIGGGFDQLPWKLYEILKKENDKIVTFNQEVIAIDAVSRNVRIRDRESRHERNLGFRHLLVTLPFPVLARLELRGFSNDKLQALRGIRYASACKDLLAYEKRFWEKEGIRGGRSKSDGPEENVLFFREAYYPMDRLPREKASGDIGLTFETEDGGQLAGMFGLFVGSTATPRGRRAVDHDAAEKPGTLLAAYTLNDGAKALQAMRREDRREAVLASLEAVHGKVVREAVHFVPWSWDDYPWAGGALAITPPKDLSEHLAAAKRAERGVHFAGEHVSIAPGWVQGSLESTLREVEAMLRSPAAEENTP